MFDVVVVGSANLDLVARTARLPHPGETVSGSSYDEFPGGKGLNQAVAAARAGASVALVGALGDDSAGRMLRDVVRSEGIDDSWLITDARRPTGRALIVVDDAAENSIVVVPGANHHATWPATAPPVGRVVLAQLEVPLDVVEACFRSARRAGATTVLNPAPAIELPSTLLASCSIVVPNEHEAILLGGNSRLLDSDTTDAVIVTRGAEGVDIVQRSEAHGTVIDHVAAYEVDPVDTTGAGDAFCGNLAACFAHGATLADAVDWASAAGALATTIRGAVPSLPARESVERLARSR